MDMKSRQLDIGICPGERSPLKILYSESLITWIAIGAKARMSP